MKQSFFVNFTTFPSPLFCRRSTPVPTPCTTPMWLLASKLHLATRSTRLSHCFAIRWHEHTQCMSWRRSSSRTAAKCVFWSSIKPTNSVYIDIDEITFFHIRAGQPNSCKASRRSKKLWSTSLIFTAHASASTPRRLVQPCGKHASRS